MAGIASSRPGTAPPRGGTVDEAARVQHDDWPYTTRLMPWLIAGFLVMVWLVPFDAMTLPIALPVDSAPDRLFLPILGFVWVLGLLSTRFAVRRQSTHGIGPALFIFASVAFASIILNIAVLELSGDADLGIKKLAILISYGFFFLVVLTTLRRSELPAFAMLIVGLACITALGTILQYRTGTNVFFEWADKLSFAGIDVHEPTVQNAAWERPNVAGPTQHGLAVATMMAFALPIPVLQMLRTQGAKRLAWACVMGILLAGSISTLRKTGIVLPIVALAVIFAYRPRPMLGLLPIGLVLILAMNVIAPGALGNLKSQFSAHRINNNSTTGRTADYRAVQPDIANHPVIGRGFGTYDPFKYRFIDNEYLKRLIETGWVGACAYLLLILSVFRAAHRGIRRKIPSAADPALWAASAAGAYAVGSALFDIFFFPQAPYLFFFAAAIAVLCANAEEEPQPARRVARRAPQPAPAVPVGVPVGSR